MMSADMKQLTFQEKRDTKKKMFKNNPHLFDEDDIEIDEEEIENEPTISENVFLE